MRRGVGRSWLWLLAAVAGCGENSPDGSPEAPASPAPRSGGISGALTEDGWFEDETTGFRLQVPEGWERVEPPEGTPAEVLAFESRGDGSMNLTVLCSPESRDSIEDLGSRRIDEMRDHCPGFQLLHAGSFFTKKGRPGKLVDFSWLADGAVVRQRQVIVPAPGAVFTLTATWPTGRAPEAEGDILGPALDSFELL